MSGISKYDKRLNAYWDSLYTGESMALKEHDWDFSNNKGPTQLLFLSDALTARVDDRSSSRRTITGINFDYCDFFGDFTSLDVSFQKCTFTRCDFGGTVWKGAKFSNCTFERCSLTMTEFQSCQFYNCNWSKITMSGNEMRLIDTLINNPRKFIASAYTNIDFEVLEKNKKSVSYQKMRLENTKAKVARSIYLSAEGRGDEKAYYEGLRTYINQSNWARVREAFYNLSGRKDVFVNGVRVAGGMIEFLIINLSGFINAWGRSIVRPAFIGLAVMLGFGLLYGFLSGNYYQGILQGFDITFLVGYTKHAMVDKSLTDQALYATNAFLGLWWYAILVPTVINRLSRKG